MSITSWLVAPQCTQLAASPPTSSRSLRTIGSAGAPAARAPGTSASRSKSSARQDAAITPATSAGIDPGTSPPRPRAPRSKSSIASQPRAVRHRLPQLVRDEDGVERHRSKNAVWSSPCSLTSKRRTSPSAAATSVARCSPGTVVEHGVGLVRLRLVREVHPRQHRPEQAAREDEHEEVRRLAVDRARLHREEPEAPFVVRPGAAPAEVRRRTRRPRSACQISTIASTTGSPAPSSTRPSTRIAPPFPRRRARPDAGRRARSRRTVRRSATGSGRAQLTSRAGSPPVRRARCRSGSRAPTRASSSPSRRC